MKASKIDVGQKAPDFTLTDQEGKTFRLYDELEHGPVLIAFYPADFTSVCTKQLCDYRDNFAEFRKLGVQIVGISHDDGEQHAKFSDKYKFPFRLLSDPNKSVAKLFDCTSIFMFGAVTRGVVIVDRKGTLVYRHVEPTPISHQDSDELVKILSDMKGNQLI